MRMRRLLARPLPERLRVAVIALLLRTFARTFDVQPPRISHCSSDEALYAFREFSAACMDAALESPSYAAAKRAELERRARALGGAVRFLLAPRDDEFAYLTARLYDVIGVTMGTGQMSPTILVGDIWPVPIVTHCYFGERYTPELCAFMSAFDSGVVGGLAGGGSLMFESRITEGAPCCTAVLVREGPSDCGRSGCHFEGGGNATRSDQSGLPLCGNASPSSFDGEGESTAFSIPTGGGNR